MTDGAPADGDGREVRHVFTVDVEEYFQVHAFEDLVHTEEWDCYPSRVARATDRLLELLDASGTRATFFVLGWIADRHPQVVRRIADQGHEVASHSWWHERVGDLTPKQFRRDARRSKRELEDLVGRRVHGYRAPSFSLVPGNEWMLEVLAEEGYRYDSSLFPSRRIGGEGFPGASRTPHLVETPSRDILELPLMTMSWAGVPVPAAGGAYLRHFPYAWVRRALREMEADGNPGVFYVHPWELDPEQPTIPGSLTARVRHYRNLDRTERRLQRLLDEFDFTSVRDRFGLAGEDPPRRPSPTPDISPGFPSKGVGS